MVSARALRLWWSKHFAHPVYENRSEKRSAYYSQPCRYTGETWIVVIRQTITAYLNSNARLQDRQSALATTDYAAIYDFNR
jgi:hypothetical protein